MANTTIPNLPAATSLVGTEQLWAVQSGTDVRVTSAQIAALASTLLGLISIESVTVLGANSLAPLLHTPTTGIVMICVNGQAFFEVGLHPAFTLTANVVTWISPLYDIQTTDDVIALYAYSHP